MAKIEEILAKMQNNPSGIRYHDLFKVCDNFFGEARQVSSSHRVYRTLWPGDPRVNIQNKKGMAKVYQVRQVLRAIQLMENFDDN